MMKNVNRRLGAYNTEVLKPCLNMFQDYFHVHPDETKLWFTPEFSFVCAQANPIRNKHQVLQKSANIPVLYKFTSTDNSAQTMLTVRQGTMLTSQFGLQKAPLKISFVPFSLATFP